MYNGFAVQVQVITYLRTLITWIFPLALVIDLPDPRLDANSPEIWKSVLPPPLPGEEYASEALSPSG